MFVHGVTHITHRSIKMLGQLADAPNNKTRAWVYLYSVGVSRVDGFERSVRLQELRPHPIEAEIRVAVVQRVPLEIKKIAFTISSNTAVDRSHGRCKGGTTVKTSNVMLLIAASHRITWYSLPDL